MKIGFISLGCPKNLVDSEVMLGLTQQAGHSITRDPADADVLVVNTCAFIDSAKQESVDAILEAATHKRSGKVRLVVAGCLAERYGEELRREIPEIDVVLGTHEVPNIVEAVTGTASGAVPLRLFKASELVGAVPQSRAKGHPSAAAAPGAPTARNLPVEGGRLAAPGRLPTYIYDADTPRVLTTPRHYAYVKVAEGCDYKCAFCIIPKLRGAYRSRPVASVVREARGLAAQGVREIILISQDTTFFGVDRGERGALAQLLQELEAVDGLEWIRLLYLYPTTIDDRVLDVMADSPRVCRYIDLPLQHASASVLKRMRRPGTGDTYRRLLARIRDRVPGVTLRTTLIVGFPGETDKEFEELREFVRDVRFDHLGVFTYSHEGGTTAFDLDDDVLAHVKAERQGELMRLQRDVVRERNEKHIGDRGRMVVDGPSPEHELVLRGRLESQAPDIDSVTYLSDCDPAEVGAGTFLDVEIRAAHGYDLVAQPVDGSPSL